MRNTLLILLCVVMAACGAQKETLSEGQIVLEKQRIKDCFSGYKTAIQNDKPVDAVEYVDRRTLNYYQRILKKIKSADSTEVNTMSITDKIILFSVRHQAPKEKILALHNGKELLTYTIQSGMVGTTSFDKIEIGEIELKDNFAKGQAMINDKPELIYFHFYKEEKKWKIDLTSVLSTSNQAIQQMINKSGQEENDYLFNLLEFTTGEKPKKEIWQKIKLQ